MRFDRHKNRSSHASSLATSASALVALVAIAALMSSSGAGANIRGALLESRAASTEAPTVRAVAAAVAAAARELVGGERITAAMHADQYSDVLIAADHINTSGIETADILLSRPIAERLIDLPPPSC